MASPVMDTPLNLGAAQDLDKVLNTEHPVLLYVYKGESLRGDVKTELEKAAKENAGRIRVVKLDTSNAPELAERFEVDNRPLLVGWVCGEVIARRSSPWGTDIMGMVEELTKHVPAGAVAMPQPEQVVEKVPVENKPVKVTEATFERDVIKSTLPVLVDFWAPWCGPCRQVAPVLDKLAGEFAGKIRIAKVNTDENQQLAGAFNIMSIPTLMFVKNGKIVGQQAGALPEHILRDAINQLINLKV